MWNKARRELLAKVYAARGQVGQQGKMDSVPPRVLFVTRDTVVHAFHGAITAVHNLLGLLERNGMDVTVLVTSAASRSPRLLFRATRPLPAGVRLKVPGFLPIGRWFVRPFASRAWARVALRASARLGLSAALARLLHAAGADVFDRPWDLTEPTPAERRLLRDTVAALQPDAVVANYAFWGPVLRDLRTGDAAEPRTLILMHDLLAEHVRSFAERGLPLDCNPITAELETAWLNGAETVLAIQADEAAVVRERVMAQVLVQPIELAAEPASSTPEPLRCLFVGSNSPPNVEGLAWLQQQVWPRVRRAEPQAVLAVVGSVCEHAGGTQTGVELVGPVDSLEREHRRAAVCLVPLLVGTGLKMKLLDALRFGKATVSTPVGVQGVERWVASTVAVADTAEAFAAEIIQLLREPAERRRREAAAYEVMQAHFAPGSEEERLLLDALRKRQGKCDV